MILPALSFVNQVEIRTFDYISQHFLLVLASTIFQSSPLRMTDALAVATIIIYAILIQPVFYCLWKHGRHGILGWVALQSFCLLRIIGNAILLHAEATNASNSNALLISNIGLSPLLLAALGFLHEASVRSHSQA